MKMGYELRRYKKNKRKNAERNVEGGRWRRGR